MSLDTTTAAFCDSSQLNHDVSSHSTGGNEESVRHAGVCHTLAGRDRKCGWKQSDKKEDKEKEQIKKNWDDEEEHIRGKQTIIARDLSRSSEDADKQKCSFFDQRSSFDSRHSDSVSVDHPLLVSAILAQSRSEGTTKSTPLFLSNTSNELESPDMATRTSSEQLNSVSDIPTEDSDEGRCWIWWRMGEELLWEMRKSRTSSR
ncbi:hypothetical protein BLNAU_9432 [Blattamonas nauphoetae]|uniref:Uncharacterized protein n=1 Tax=Blattamonas nauphoetae TaxID=2049346 RepID=A0ABQ9XVQ9_9EUKA|nr:hypothetical protein BLNAU_9432 [Blattamonas nauphoetae]